MARENLSWGVLRTFWILGPQSFALTSYGIIGLSWIIGIHLDGWHEETKLDQTCVCVYVYSKAMAILWMHMDATPSYCYIELGAPNLLIFGLIFGLKKPRIFNVEVPWSQDRQFSRWWSSQSCWNWSGWNMFRPEYVCMFSRYPHRSRSNMIQLFYLLGASICVLFQEDTYNPV